ncbi:MAG: thiamine pyrophosphate-binding protein [Deltaproteobacteria bacterium]|nr:thiamine pyrophosphate-binding protein [Deltaproteobacteria bacterium]
MKMDGGEMVVRMLKKEGVTHIFSLSGGHINPIYNACLDHSIRIIDTRHEQGAAFMADGWARVTRSPGVGVFTAGPGHTNAITGLKAAELAQSPVVAISGHSELSRLEMGALQEMDQVRAAEAVTKRAWLVAEAKRIPEYISMAFRHALTFPYGPVNVNIPIDLMMQKWEEEQIHFPLGYRTDSLGYGDPHLVERAAETLQKAARPAVIVGNAAWYSQAEEELLRFAEATHIPIFTQEAARGLIPDNHPDCYGEPNGRINGAAELLAECDVVLLLNVVLNSRLQYGEIFNPKAALIQVESHAAAIGYNRTVELGIVGSPKCFLQQLIGTAEEKGPFKTQEWGSRLRKRQMEKKRTWEDGWKSKERPIHPLRLAREITDFLGEDDMVVFDGGDIKFWVRTTLGAAKPGHTVDNGPFGSLGSGIPHAIAAKVAFPRRRVLIVNGDGSFGLNAMEFDTAVRHNIPIVSVIGNDQAWGMILHNQREFYGNDRVVGSRLGPVRYDRLVEALGGYGELVEDPSEIKPALERAFASGKPACVNVMTQARVSPVTEASLLWKVKMDPTLALKTGDIYKT